ncbi:N-6 DNA methylase [Nonomuraea rosea]
MSHDPTVNAGDIARLAGVGRAAVSNWRRRHDDFPQPVGGTANQPLFSLRQVESWLRRYGKSYQVSLGDRVWQRLKAAGDLRLGELVAQAGVLLTRLAETRGADPATGEAAPGARPGDAAPSVGANPSASDDLPGVAGRHATAAPSAGVPGSGRTGAPGVRRAAEGHPQSSGSTSDAAGDGSGVAGGGSGMMGEGSDELDPELVALVTELAEEHDPLTAYEFLCERYLEAHSRQLSVTRDDVAELMVRLVSADGATILDPACGVGTLLLAPAPTTGRTGNPATGQTSGQTSGPASRTAASQTGSPAGGQASGPASRSAVGRTGGSAAGQTGAPASGPAVGQTGGQASGLAGSQAAGPAGGQTAGSAGGQTAGSAGGQTGGQAGSQMSGPAGGQPGGQAGGQMSGPTGGQPGGPAGGQMSGQAGGPAGGQVDAPVGGQLGGSAAGGPVGSLAGELAGGAGVRMLGQDLSETSAIITASRLRLRGIAAEVVAGDSMRNDGFPNEKADAVVCDPPFNERAWGYEELTGDPRWEHGLPPRGEPELAWVQHCLTHVKPRGLVAILMPPAAASRKAGRRIRANLLRAGALRAVVALPGSDLWLLRRPAPGERPPSDVLIIDATADLSAVEPAWQAYLEDRSDQTVRIIDLLADEVDMTPARHERRDDVGRAFAEARDRFLAAAAVPPDLQVLEQPLDQPATTLGDLIKEGLVATSQAPPKMSADGGDVPVLTTDDVLNGTPPSGFTTMQQGLVAIRPGDVVASYSSVRVVADGGAVLGPHLTLYRVDARRLDPDFLAGFLRAAGGRVTTGSSRFDVRRTRLPRLSLKEQKAYGESFRQLAVLEDAIRETSTLGQALIRLGLDGLADGHLHPQS